MNAPNKKRRSTGNTGPSKKKIAFLCLLLIYFAGCYVRSDEFTLWNKFPSVFYHDDKPVLINCDGYYYMRLARDLTEKRYTRVDPLRLYPDNAPRPYPPPLISWLSAINSMSTTIPLEWVCALIPVFLGPMLIFPVYGISRLFGGGRAMGLTAALFTVLSIGFVNRTSIGVLDTDCLNIAFTCVLIFFSMAFALEPTKKRYAYILAGILFFGLFLIWWDMARIVVCGIFLFTFGIAILFFYRPPKIEGAISLGVSCALLCCALLWKGAEVLPWMIDRVARMFVLTFSDSTEFFPTAASYIGELRPAGIREFIDLSMENSFALLLSLVGLGALIATKKKASLFLVLLMALTSLSFISGARFVIFFTPIAALGLGFLAHEAWRKRMRTPLFTWFTPIAVALLATPLFYKNIKIQYLPVVAGMRSGIHQASLNTPENAVIWTTWDISNPLMYYANRRTIADAQFNGSKYFSGERIFYSCLPLASTEPRFSANFIQFYSKRGMAGIHKFYEAAENNPATGLPLLKEILSAGPEDSVGIITEKLFSKELHPLEGLAGPEDWIPFFFPPAAPPVFLLLHKNIVYESWWYNTGSWDIDLKRGRDPLHFPMKEISFAREKLVVGGREINTFNIQSGGSIARKKKGKLHVYKISSMAVRSEKSLAIHDYEVENGFSLEIYTPGRFGAIMDKDFSKSLFNRLLIRHDAGNNYFRLVSEKLPSYQMWEVFGEPYKGRIGDKPKKKPRQTSLPQADFEKQAH